MLEKLDPTLRELVEAQALETGVPVTVLVGLNAPAGPEELEELRARGLLTRSVLGEIVTGTIALADLARVAEHPLVAKIEASRPMRPELPE